MIYNTVHKISVMRRILSKYCPHGMCAFCDGSPVDSTSDKLNPCKHYCDGRCAEIHICKAREIMRKEV